MYKILTCLVVTTASFSLPLFAQTNSEVLRKDNEKLKQSVKELQNDTASLRAKLRFHKALDESKELDIKSFSKDFTVKLLSCKGNPSTQTVKIELLISHNRVHQNVCIATKSTHAKAYDELGNEFGVKGTAIGVTTEGDAYGVNAVCDKIPTDVPVRSHATFKNILPSTSKFKFVSISFKYRNEDSNDSYQVGVCEIKDLTIQW